MDSKRLIFPVRGASTETAFIDQPGDTFAPGTCRNVRVFDSSKKRPRGGSRPGLKRLLPGTIGTGMVQALLSVNRASSTSLVLGAASDISGTAKSGAAGSGNGTFLDETPSVLAMVYDDTSDDGGPGTSDISACCFSKDGAYLFTATNYTNGTNYRSRIKCWNVTTKALVWSHTISEASVDRFTNTMVASSWLLLVCGGKSTGVGTVRTIRISDGTQMGSDFTCNGWAYECIEAGVYGSGSAEYAMIGFYGSAAAGTTTGGPITAGFIALNFRSGVMKCRVVQPTDTGPFVYYLSQVTLGTQLASTDANYEAAHNYLRISEQPEHSGHGCAIQALAVNSSGTFVIARTNQGYGKDATAANAPSPDLNGGLPYVSLACYSANGTMLWENNVAESVTDVLGPYGYTDLDNPTFNAVAIDSTGNVYVAGRQNSSGYSVYALDSNGAFRWRQEIGVQARQACCRIDSADGNVLVCGDRNSLWGGGGTNANAWKLSSNDGSILWGWDFGVAVSASSVAVSGSTIFLGTEKV